MAVVDCRMMDLFVTTTEAHVVALFMRWRGFSSPMLCAVSWVLFFHVYSGLVSQDMCQR